VAGPSSNRTPTIEHPLVLAPMAGFATAVLAASVCAAGGLGSIGCATVRPQSVMEAIKTLRALTSKPFKVNFFCHTPAQANFRREEAWLDQLAGLLPRVGARCPLAAALYRSPAAR
jgi:nitronate monooxygenase